MFRNINYYPSYFGTNNVYDSEINLQYTTRELAAELCVRVSMAALGQ